MKITAKSVTPNHKHREGRCFLQFGPDSMLTTTDDYKISILKKHNGKPGFWAIINSNAGMSEKEHYKKIGRPWLIVEAIKLGFSIELNRHPKTASNGELIEFIKYKRK